MQNGMRAVLVLACLGSSAHDRAHGNVKGTKVPHKKSLKSRQGKLHEVKDTGLSEAGLLERNSQREIHKVCTEGYLSHLPCGP